MENIKFISYDGSYPCLCMGTLTIEAEGETYSLDSCLSSSGSVWFDEEWNEHVEVRDWSVYNLPYELEDYYEEITKLVNDNIPSGCCGGCI